MTVTITIEPGSDWLEQIRIDLLDNLTTGQVTELALLVTNELASRALDAEGQLGMDAAGQQ